MRPNLSLVSSIRSDGPTLDQMGKLKSSPCPKCDGPISRGDEITKLWRQWFHTECAKQVITAVDVREAWRLIAMDVARSPRSYGVREIRVVMENLIAAAQVDEVEHDFADDAAAEDRFA